jgi:hypothetical protein
MIKRRAGITVGMPPKYVGFESSLYKVISIAPKSLSNRALLYECKCKACGGTHLRNAKQLKHSTKAQDCPKYRAPNWSGLTREDAIMRRQYGISMQEFHELLEYQNGGCAVCGKPIEAVRRRMNVDHCHETGQVRGILCTGCNTGIGHLGDTVEGLQRAIEYLKNPPFAKYALAR